MSIQQQMDALSKAGLLSLRQLHAARDIQQQTRECFGRILIRLGYVSEQELLAFYEFQCCACHIQLAGIKIPAAVLRTVPRSIAERCGMIPVRRQGRKLTVAMTDPLDDEAMDDLKSFSGLDIQPAAAAESEILQAIDTFYGMDLVGADASESAENGQWEDEGAAVRMVNAVLKQAVLEQASDIHLEPSERMLRIRFRVDGALRVFFSLPMKLHAPLTSRIKVMSALDIAEKRLPQDGRMQYQMDGGAMDLRISVMPTILGETIVMRLLYQSADIAALDKLGFSAFNLAQYRRLYSQPYGMVLVTGPTGSGKTTTLYSTLSGLNTADTNILTIEDPVEYRLPGVNQVQVNPKAGLTFAVGLRSMLRQDPNILMVGEIRDGETANIAVRAALTGHLVFTSACTRLVRTISKK